MAEIMDLSRYAKAPDLDAMDRGALLEALDAVRAQIAALDGREPEEMASDCFEDWADRHEELEDLADDILDRLDEMGGSRG